MVRTDPAATDTCTVPTAQVKSLLSLPSDQEAVHLLWRSLNLTVWSISGEPIMQTVSLQKWQKSFSHHGPSQLRSAVRAPGEPGPSGVLPETCVPFRHRSRMSWPSWQRYQEVGPWNIRRWQCTCLQFHKDFANWSGWAGRSSSDVSFLWRVSFDSSVKLNLGCEMFAYFSSDPESTKLYNYDAVIPQVSCFTGFDFFNSCSWIGWTGSKLCLHKEWLLGVPLANHTKVSRPCHPPREIYLPAFQVNPKISVVPILHEYQSRTEAKRKSSRLLVSYVRHFNPTSS